MSLGGGRRSWDFWNATSEYTKKSEVELKTYTNEKRVSDGSFTRDEILTRTYQAALGAGVDYFLTTIGAGKLGKIAGTAIIGVSWKNLEVRKRNAADVVDVGNWYGKVKQNSFTGTIIAQDFYGFQKTGTVKKSIYVEYQVVDTQHNRVLFTFIEKAQMPFGRLPQKLQFKDFGNF